MNKLLFTKRAVIFLSFLVLFTTLAFPVYGASEQYYQRALEYREKTCSIPKINEQINFLCYLFDKVQELDQDLTETRSSVGLESAINSTQSAKIQELEERLSTLESSISAELQNKQIVIAENEPQPVSKKVTIPAGYKSMTVSVSSGGTLENWAPLVSFDGQNYREQHRFRCTATCETVTIPVLSPDYLFNTGTAGGLISIMAVLNPEADSQILILSEDTLLPFQSEEFSAEGFNSVDLTVGGGNDPQNLDDIILQKKNEGVFEDYHILNCDGGAECPLDSIPLSEGIYRVQVVGSGDSGVIGAILRNTFLN